MEKIGNLAKNNPGEPFSYLSSEDRRQALELARLIAKRDWVLFVGSGVSHLSGLPLWSNLVELMSRQLGPEADEIKDPLEVASLFETIFGRNTLIGFLKECLQKPDFNPNSLHGDLLNLRPPEIITTNFDNLFERALERQGIPYALVVSDFDLGLIADRLPILKAHGDLNQPGSLVFTRHDYVGYPQQKYVNAKLCSLAGERSFLFVGYGLGDPDLEQQLRWILDAQGNLARSHYLVVDKINPLRRQAFRDQRKIQTIEIGSYDNLEQFLKDLNIEAARIRQSEEATRRLSFSTKSTEASDLSAAEKELLAFLEEDYEPVIEALEQLQFIEAERHLERILARIQKVKNAPALAQKSGLTDFHQRILLALAAVAGRRDRNDKAQDLFRRAEELQPFSGRRRLQAAEVLLILGAFSDAEALLLQSQEGQTGRGKEILGLAALIRNDEIRFRTLFADACTENTEFNILQARLAVKAATDATTKHAVDLLEKAWLSSQEFSLGFFSLASLTEEMLRRILAEEWEAPGVDRKELLKTVRKRYQQVVNIFEKIENQYPEGLVSILSQSLGFYHFLGEQENQQAILERLQKLPVITRERPFVEFLAGKPPPALDVIETLFQKDYLSGCEKALLTGAALIENKETAEAERIYRQALASVETPVDRHALLNALLQILLKEERSQEALAFLEESTTPEEVFQVLMRSLVLVSQKDQKGALTLLRGALERHPRSLLLLQNLFHLISSQLVEAETTTLTAIQEEDQKRLFEEALQYAEQLEALLPSFEHRILRARLLKQQSCYRDALDIVEEVDREGYGTLQILRLRCELLRNFGRNREVAELLTAYQERYPPDYALRFNEATAWAYVGEIERAVAIWEELRNHSEAGSDLYQNLFLAYVQRQSLDPSAFSRAFDVAKEALEKFPDCREFAPRLVEAALGSGRSPEAWKIIEQRPDLREGPHLVALSETEAVEFIVQNTKTQQERTAVYYAGGIPFSAYAERAPCSPVFLWQARLHLWRKRQGSAPFLCSFPREFVQDSLWSQDGQQGVLLDITALLSLGTLNITREILEALGRAGRQVFLFSGARQWLEGEVGRLSLEQVPYYRERHRRLRDLLLASRERVEIHATIEKHESIFDEVTRQQVGHVVWDVELSKSCTAVYIDDYLPAERRGELPQDTALFSSDFLTALEQTGVVLPKEAQQIRSEHPEPFAKTTTGASIAREKPVLLSFLSLQAWFDAGLLDRWLRGDSGWPPKLIVGPVAWSQLKEECTEDEIYREALQVATDLRSAIVEMLDSGVVKELPALKPPDLGGHPDVRPFFDTTLTLLQQARDQALVLWTDDFCTRSLIDPRGPLLQDPAFMDVVARARRAFGKISIGGTEDILQWLENAEQLVWERRLRLLWQMHKDGYRLLNVSEVFLWLLEQVRYNRTATPIVEFLNDLKQIDKIKPTKVDATRFQLFTSLSLSGLLSQVISGLWLLDDSFLTNEMRSEISTELVSLLEETIPQEKNRTVALQFFWKSLIKQMWLGNIEEAPLVRQQRIARLREFMGWVAEYILKDLTQHRQIVHEVEDLALDALRYLRPRLPQASEVEERSLWSLVVNLLEPVFSQGLLNEFSPVFRRLIGPAIDLDLKLTKIYEVQGPEGEFFDRIPVEEAERQACKLLSQAYTGQPSERLTGRAPFHVEILLERTVDASIAETAEGQALRLSIPEEVPLLFLPLVAEPSLRKYLFEHFRACFEQVEPPLARLINELFPDLVSDDPNVFGKALRNFYSTYLLSTHFQLTRDLVRGSRHLANLPLEELDILCGGIPPWPKEASFHEFINMQIPKGEEPSSKSEKTPPYSTLPILLGPSEVALGLSTVSDQLLQQYPENQRTQLLSQWVEIVQTGVYIFDSLRWLGALLSQAYRFPDLSVFVDGQEKPLREWLVEHLLDILGDKPRKPQAETPPKEISLPNNEIFRRSINAKVLCLAFQAVASPAHRQALSDRADRQQSQEVIGELMLKGVVLAHRILPVVLQDPRLSLEHIDQKLVTAIKIVNSFAFIDQFRPDLYGPEASQYDHLLAGTLAIFRAVEDAVRIENARAGRSSAPFWLTRPVRRMLQRLANQPENEAERSIRERREQGVPNRLQTFLNRTPQEFAKDLLQVTSTDFTKGEKLLLQGSVRLQTLLQQASDSIKIQPIEFPPEVKEIDFILRVTPVTGEESHLLVSSQASAEPRRMRQACTQLRSVTHLFPVSYCLILTQSISERARKICEENGVGYVDLHGNAFVKFGGIFIQTSASKKEVRRPGRPKTLFAPISTRVIRTLLIEPQRRWKLSELAAVAHMSLGHIHKVKQELLTQEFIEEDQEKRFFLKDPAGLLNAWQETYNYGQNQVVPLFSLEKVPAIEEKIKQYCDAEKVGYAFTLFSGASRLAPFVRQSVAAFYFFGDREALQRKLNLKQVDSGANVLLLIPYDEGVFHRIQEAKGYKIVNPIQLYLDLYSYGGRGREQAEFLREKLIGF